MIEKEESNTEKRNSVDGKENSASPNQTEGRPLNGSHHQNKTSGSADGRQGSKDDPHRFPNNLTINEWLTLLVGVGSLVVSYLTYTNAADTSDLKNAVINLTSLASDARRQADAMQAQAKTMQGQLDQMTAAQRPWLSVRDFSMGSIRIYPAGSGVSIDAKYNIVNFGHAPAIEIYINPALIFAGTEQFDKNTVKNLCLPQPLGAERLFIDYSDIVLPEQTLNIGGFFSQAGTFSHNIEKLQQEGKYTIDADFILAACITYKVLGSDVLHATGFALKAQSFNFRAPKYDPEPIPIEIGRKGEVKIVFSKLIPAPYGNFAD